MPTVKRFILTFIALLFTTTTFCAECTHNGAAPIYPEPQKVCLTAPAQLPGSISLKFSPDAALPEDIKARYIQWLGENSVSIATDGKNAGTITFEKSPNIRNSSFREEGYEIEISEKPFVIKVSALSYTGFLYALFTLQDMVSEGNILTGTIEDFPDFAYRGVLEGGYSVWSHEQRLDIIKWIGQLKMNVFMYGPKEGYYFRRRWREPFPKEALAEFQQYIDACNRDRVRFMMALSPALSIEHSNPDEIKLLVAKYQQIQDMGVKDFVIFFDDVLPVLASPADQKAYKHIAEAEADVTNQVMAALKARDPEARLAFVPRQYWGWTPTKYIEILGSTLDPDIEIGWTGVDIVSDAIPTEDAVKFKEAWGRPPAIGDNFSPLGPLVNRGPDLYKASTTFINNPYAFAVDNKAQLSKFVNSTIGDYAWNSEGYDPERSFTMGSARLAGDPQTVRELLTVLAINGRTIKSAPHRELARSVGLLEKGAGSIADVRAAFDKLGDIPTTPGGGKTKMNPMLAAHLKDEYSKAADRMKKAGEALAAAETGDSTALAAFKDALSIK